MVSGLLLGVVSSSQWSGIGGDQVVSHPLGVKITHGLLGERNTVIVFLDFASFSGPPIRLWSYGLVLHYPYDFDPIRPRVYAVGFSSARTTKRFRSTAMRVCNPRGWLGLSVFTSTFPSLVVRFKRIATLSAERASVALRDAMKDHNLSANVCVGRARPARRGPERPKA